MTSDNVDCNWNNYDTAIKDIAGVKDYTVIFDVVNSYFINQQSTDSMINDENQFDIRSSKTRSKVSWAINKSVLKFSSQAHMDLVSTVFQDDVPQNDKRFFFLWHFCLTNRLFREITISVFSTVYLSGRAQISKEDIIAFIKHLSASDDPERPNWSEDTIYRLATKYLSLMTKFDFVSSGRIKSFNHIRPSPEALVIFLYFSNLCDPKSKNILSSELIPVSFIAAEDLQNRLKKLSIKGFFDMNFNGVALNIELTHSHKEICHALYS